MQSLKCDNLNKFYGLSVEIDRKLFVVSAYCHRGSLEEVIFNSDIAIDEMFKISMIRDIISVTQHIILGFVMRRKFGQICSFQGLDYIHNSTSIGYHGDLNCSNCLVDAKWIVKITEFGLRSIINDLVKHGVMQPTAVSLGSNYWWNKMHTHLLNLWKYDRISTSGAWTVEKTRVCLTWLEIGRQLPVFDGDVPHSVSRATIFWVHDTNEWLEYLKIQDRI